MLLQCSQQAVKEIEAAVLSYTCHAEVITSTVHLVEVTTSPAGVTPTRHIY